MFFCRPTLILIGFGIHIYGNTFERVSMLTCQEHRERKHEVKKHFDTVGGYHNVDAARAHPSKNWFADA